VSKLREISKYQDLDKHGLRNSLEEHFEKENKRSTLTTWLFITSIVIAAASLTISIIALSR
jgi:hypothetical protein